MCPPIIRRLLIGEAGNLDFYMACNNRTVDNRIDVWYTIYPLLLDNMRDDRQTVVAA